MWNEKHFSKFSWQLFYFISFFFISKKIILFYFSPRKKSWFWCVKKKFCWSEVFQKSSWQLSLKSIPFRISKKIATIIIFSTKEKSWFWCAKWKKKKILPQELYWIVKFLLNILKDSTIVGKLSFIISIFDMKISYRRYLNRFFFLFVPRSFTRNFILFQQTLIKIVELRKCHLRSFTALFIAASFLSEWEGE